MDFIQTAILNKDVFTSLVILGIFSGMVLPMINKQNKDIKEGLDKIIIELQKFNESFYNHTLDDAKQLTNIFSKLEEHRDEANKEFVRIAQNSLKTVLDKEQTISLLKTNMWYVTGKKLDFIKAILLNNHIAGNEKKIREKLFNGLMALSDEYMANFSTYHTPIGDLSKWMMDNFGEKDFNKLVDECLEIIYKKYEWNENENILNKTNEIGMIMKTIQVGLSNKLRSDISKI